jgi:excinuclease ABC subunit B
MYSDVITDSMRLAIDETTRRREVQRSYNEAHGITPKSVKKNILDLSAHLYDISPAELPAVAEGNGLMQVDQIRALIAEYGQKMQTAADEMEFETAAELRDKILLLKEMELGLKPPSKVLLEAKTRTADSGRPTRAAPARYRRRR